MSQANFKSDARATPVSNQHRGLDKSYDKNDQRDDLFTFISKYFENEMKLLIILLIIYEKSLRRD